MADPAPTYPGNPDKSYLQANYPQQQQPYYQPSAPQYTQPAPAYPDQSYPQANYPQQLQQYPQAYYPPPVQPFPQQVSPGQVAYVGQPYPGFCIPAGNGQPQPQQSTAIINAATPTVVAQHPHLVSSFTKHLVFAFIVFGCCGWLFGAIAFYLALSAQKHQPSDPETARRQGRASLGVSIAGVAVGIFIIIVVVPLCTVRD